MSNPTMAGVAGEPELDVKRLARILDDAWERMVAICGEAEATAANRATLASRIVLLAQQGESDERQMGKAAAIYLSALIAARRLQQRTPETSVSRVTPLREHAGGAYDADALAAMEEGLALCREALPDPIPSTISAFLLTSILDQAAKGERNPVQLCNRALQALRTRR